VGNYDRLDQVSPSFCLAKWYQVTIHLQNGHTHSCHHPQTHLVPLAELVDNPSALHNTVFKKQQRKKMLKGTRPAECDYCWRVEDAAKDNISDRTLKSKEFWAEPHFDEAKSLPWDANVVPTYLEVSFSNVCNFKCSYCSPRDSSKWADEVKQHGPFPVAGRIDVLKPFKKPEGVAIPEREENPYVDAFWKWWPEIYPKLKVFRVTGGEPLLSKHTMRVLEWILEHPQPDLHLAINSNLVVPKEIYDRFLGLVSKIVARGCVKNFELYTSVDAHGKRAEYIRDGLDYGTWLANVRKFFETIPEKRLVIMCAFNALSVTSFSRMYADVIELRKAYPTTGPGASADGRIYIDLPYLRHPEHQCAMVLPPEYGERVDAILAEMQRIPEAASAELLKLTRIRSLMRHTWPEKKLRAARANFFRFFSEHDRRRGTNFLETFPEMAEFWQVCRDAAESSFFQTPVGTRVLKAFATS
jgi:organic radical activating enzyme